MIGKAIVAVTATAGATTVNKSAATFPAIAPIPKSGIFLYLSNKCWRNTLWPA